MKKNVILFLLLVTFIISFTYNKHVEADTLPQARIVIDTPTNNQGIISGNSINIKGWAVNKLGIKDVQVIMDGNFLIGAQYYISRPDVDAAMPGYPSGVNSGFISSIVAPSTPGNHTITISAIGNDGSTNSSNVNINVLPQADTVIDTPTNDQEIISGNSINIKGWAVNKAGIKNVQVIMDGNFLVGAQYYISRPDVDAAMPGYPSGANSGFICSMSAPSTPGKHTITISAIGNDGSTNSSNVNINVLPQARTVIDTPTNNQEVISGSSINIKGWSVNKSGIKDVQVSMDGSFLFEAQYSISRPDVNAAMPGYPSGDNSGFTSPIVAPSTLGNHTITISAIGNDGSTNSSNVNINVLPQAAAVIDTTTIGNQIVAYAKQFLGVPYVWGGTTPYGFDCSGFVQYVYANNGSYEVQLPRTTYEQINVGTPISTANLQPGDLVFFGSASAPYHVGIYIGLNQFIESPCPGANVRISTLSTRTDFCAAMRIIN